MSLQVDATVRLDQPLQSFEMENEIEAPSEFPASTFEVLGEFGGEYPLDNVLETDREFKLVTKDQRAISVRGRGVKFVTAPTGEPFWGVVGPTGSEDLFVALVPFADVRAVLNGDVTVFVSNP